MSELSQIILWTLRPAMAVKTNLIDIIRSGVALFNDDETIEAMASDPDTAPSSPQPLPTSTPSST